jgi:molecular chaperone GrpE
MATNGKEKKWNSIPVRFFDEEAELETTAETDGSNAGSDDANSSDEDTEESIFPTRDRQSVTETARSPREPKPGEVTSGPMLAELLATRAELKRVESELAEVQDRLARRQADFENYRKRIERDRSETHNRAVADVVNKFLPVIDNLRRALEAERSLEASESPEFRHFLHGVELINKQLDEVLESLGVEVVPARGERFDPYLHEAVVTEPTREFKPDTVIQEIVRGYRLGDRLLRPAMVKVATEPTADEE